MMAVAMIFLLVVVAVIAVIVVVAMGGRGSKLARDREVDRILVDKGRVETLEYVVPTGQDPAAVVAALQREGYNAVRKADQGEELVLVPCPAGQDRERAHVRAIISGTTTTIEDGAPIEERVHFQDER
jgi:hypothetical protein